jgi:osmotically-inducible protein OsmY
MDPDTIERTVQDALRHSPETRHVAAKVHALGDGLVELTGTAPDAASRRAAGDTARSVPGAEVVVNRILIEGNDAPVRKPVPPSAR